MNLLIGKINQEKRWRIIELIFVVLRGSPILSHPWDLSLRISALDSCEVGGGLVTGVWGLVNSRLVDGRFRLVLGPFTYFNQVKGGVLVVERRLVVAERALGLRARVVAGAELVGGVVGGVLLDLDVGLVAVLVVGGVEGVDEWLVGADGLQNLLGLLGRNELGLELLVHWLLGGVELGVEGMLLKSTDGHVRTDRVLAALHRALPRPLLLLLQLGFQAHAGRWRLFHWRLQRAWALAGPTFRRLDVPVPVLLLQLLLQRLLLARCSWENAWLLLWDEHWHLLSYEFFRFCLLILRIESRKQRLLFLDECLFLLLVRATICQFFLLKLLHLLWHWCIGLYISWKIWLVIF